MSRPTSLFHVTVADPRSRTGVKRLPTIWGVALVAAGGVAVSALALGLALAWA